MSNNLGLTPKEIVTELDKHIIGQFEAKKAVAVALRNRYRRKLVSPKLREEISPKNILMIGSTGVGKTEIARRLAKLSKSPFLKVEATKFTEVGYVGRDVESIIRDLVEIAVVNLKIEAKKEVEINAQNIAYNRILDVMVGHKSSEDTRAKFEEKLKAGNFDDKEIEIEVNDTPNAGSGSFDIPGMPGAAMGIVNVGDMLSKAMGISKKKLKKLKVKDAIELITSEEAEKLIDEDNIIMNALKTVENDGIVFLDEIDKIASKGEHGGGRGEVSREGVQRDLLPLIEGTTVTTKYGFVKTDFILFIASGAFHANKPSDLLPELQGRFPIRVELKSLTKEDFIRILSEPESSLIKQYKALLETEAVEINFTDCGIKEIADMAEHLNNEVENIGARRLHTLIEKLLEEISYDADSNNGKKFEIDEKFVKDRLSSLKKNIDLSKFIL